MFAYVGTYTGPGKGDGIYVFRYDAGTGALSPVETVAGVDSPSFLGLGRGRDTLYAVNEGDNPGVSAFRVNGETGKLAALNRQPSHGTSPCYVSVDPTGRYVLVANYGNGTVSVFPIQADGSLGEATDVVQHRGRSHHPSRQQGPHAHFIAPDPAGERIVSCDLGIDRILIYRLDGETGTLTPNDLPYAQVSSGSGPRHLAFHPNGRFVFVLNEINSTLASFAYDAERGAFDARDTRSTLPDDFGGRNSCAQVVAHPNGRFVYASNRGHDSIAVFEIDAERGMLRPLGHEPTQGKTPRNFNLDPAGRFLLAANQNTGTIVTFAVDGETGALTPAGHVAGVPAPVCIVFREE